MIKASVLDVISGVALLTGGVVAIGYLLSVLVLRRHDWVKSLFGCFCIGLLFPYAWVLAQLPISALTYVFVAAVVVAASVAFRRSYPRNALGIWGRSWPFYALSVLFIVFAFVASRAILDRLFYEPVYQWDARAMWYLRAKQLFYANGFSADSGQYNPRSEWNPHPEYPLLMPTLGAYISRYVGFWNNYIPKMNLLVLFIGLIIALLSARAIHWVWKCAAFILLVGFNPYMMSIGYNPLLLTIGYVDGWLAIYASLCLFFLLLFIQFRQKEYLFNAVAAALLLPNLKNEGMLLVGLILGAYAFWTGLLYIRQRRQLVYMAKRWLRFWPIVIWGAIPLVMWGYYKAKWGFHATDYNFNQLTDTGRYATIFSAERLSLIRADYINRCLSGHYWAAVGTLLAVVLVYLRFVNLTWAGWRQVMQTLLIPLSAGLGFMAVMVVVYCLSVPELKWLLSTSSDRLGLHSYYLSGMVLVPLIFSLCYAPYRSMKPAPIAAPEAPKTRVAPPKAAVSLPKTKAETTRKQPLKKDRR